jgi:hypothetical protein
MTPDELTDAFEAGRIAGSDFRHADHVRVAWTLAQRHPREEAYGRVVAGIRAMTVASGKPDAYHRTITRAWFELIAAAPELDDDSRLFDKTLLRGYYSPERLAAGREEWLEPDLLPLER